MTQSGVLVVGSITADVTAFANQLPRPGETVLGRDVTLVLGGKGANQAVAAAHFGAPTWMVGCVGRDPFGTIAIDGLHQHGVDTQFVRAVDHPTGVAHIRVDASGQNDIVITPLANSDLAESDVDGVLATLRDQANVLLLQLEVRPEITTYAAAAGSAAGLTVVLDPAPAIALPESVWRQVSLVTPNETEASLITGIHVIDRDSAFEAATWFLERGTTDVIITMGAAGAAWASASDRAFFEPVPVQAVDTTAAGDAFTGTLGAALSDGESVHDAIRHGMAAGALATTKPGASPSLPYRKEILSALDTTLA